MALPKNAILHESPEFKEFWQIWLPIKHRNDGRLSALDGFNKMVAAGADPRDIIDGARWYVRNLPAGYQFIAHAKTWINAGVWMDLCEQERAFQARPEPNVTPIRAVMPARKTTFLEQWEKQKAE